MHPVRSRFVTAAAGAALLLALSPALAQSGGDGKAAEQQKSGQPVDAAKERQKRIDEFAEAERQVKGAAGQPECVWLGRRIVSLLWRDDLDTAFRHIDLYDRFGCPGAHIQMTFRCLVRNGNIDPKVPEALNNRVHACWIDPSLRVAATAAPVAPGAAAKPGAQ
jgi:hypothetical protein